MRTDREWDYADDDRPTFAEYRREVLGDDDSPEPAEDEPAEDD